MTHADEVTTRPATPADAESITAVFLASRQAAMPYLPRLHSDDETLNWIRHIVLPTCTVWVATLPDQVIGFAALNDNELDHLYLHPDWHRRGIGSRLLRLATEHSPHELNLKVFQRNTAARDFYERHGFVAIDTNNGTRNEENEPDMTYRWTPR